MTQVVSATQVNNGGLTNVRITDVLWHQVCLFHSTIHQQKIATKRVAYVNIYRRTNEYISFVKVELYTDSKQYNTSGLAEHHDIGESARLAFINAGFKFDDNDYSTFMVNDVHFNLLAIAEFLELDHNNVSVIKTV
jgi:hypothetical protein